MLVQAGLCLTCSETTLLVFPRGGSVVLSRVGCLCMTGVNPDLTASPGAVRSRESEFSVKIYGFYFLYSKMHCVYDMC